VILSESDRARARAIVGDVEAALASWPVSDTTLHGGSAGIALFLASREAPSTRDAARHHLEHALAALDVGRSPALFEGFTGIAWVAEQIWSRLYDDEELDLSEIDDVVLELLDTNAIAEYALGDGLVGIGVYGLGRDAPARFVHRVVERLAERASEDRGGITWRTPPERLPPKLRARHPRGYASLGMAHGIDGVIAFLGQVHRRGLGTARSRELLEGAVTWLLACRIDAPSGTVPLVIAPDEPPRPAPCAWCYGELPAAMALLAAARGLARDDWEDCALGFACTAASRPVTGTGVHDAGLCHGAAGLGHMFLRLHEATRDPRLRYAAQAWLVRAMELRDPAREVAGFAAFDPTAPSDPWIPLPGYLLGAAGVGLALASACGEVDVAWDTPLLVI
jgi:lantibiotic biosynthesis protein